MKKGERMKNFKELSSKGAISKGVSSKGVISKGVSSKGVISKGVSPKEGSSKELNSKQVISKQTRLTPKQDLFAKEYLVDLNATQAAIRAGYSQKTACVQGARLLVQPVIQASIEKAMNLRGKKIDRIALDVLHDIQEVTKKAMEEGDYKTSFKGLELEGKHFGMFKDKLEVTGHDGDVIRHEVEHSMSPMVQEIIQLLEPKTSNNTRREIVLQSNSVPCDTRSNLRIE